MQNMFDVDNPLRKKQVETDSMCDVETTQYQYVVYYYNILAYGKSIELNEFNFMSIAYNVA